jgi:hypothetical protein
VISEQIPRLRQVSGGSRGLGLFQRWREKDPDSDAVVRKRRANAFGYSTVESGSLIPARMILRFSRLTFI